MRRPFHRSAAISLALCAMVLRALLPDGWMPSAHAAVSPFVICSADGTHKDGKPQPPRERTHAPCAFASAAPLATPAVVAVAAPREATRLAFAPTQIDVATTQAHRPNAARAPPAFS